MYSGLGTGPRRRRFGGLSLIIVGLVLAGSVAGLGKPVAMAAPPAPRDRPEPPTRPGEPPSPHDVPNEWIVELKPGVPSHAVAAEHGKSGRADVHHVYADAVDGYAATMSDDEAARVARDPRVASVTRDRVIFATAQTIPNGIKRIGAPVSGTGVSTDVDVAVVDTGIAAHPDLTIAGGKNCNGSGTSYDDGHGHGTHVAGTIAAKNDSSGVVGVAPGARLWAVRVLNQNGSGTWAEIICGLDWVHAHGGIEVVNMSLAGPGSEGSNCASSPLRSAICNLKAAGVTVVVAAGNDTNDADSRVPATYPEVITVSALVDTDGLAGGLGSSCSGADDRIASFSNYGPDIDVIAPGTCVYSTYTGGGYRSMSGTSMASPHAAGVAALFMAANPTAAPDDVRAHLINSGSSDWNNATDRDAIKEPLVMAASTPPAPDPVPVGEEPPSSITLTVTKPRPAATRAILQWSGASGAKVEIWRKRSTETTLVKIATTANDGKKADEPGRGTWDYKVCEIGGTVCSPAQSVTI